MLRRLMLRNFELAHRLDRWVRERFTAPGRWVAGTAIGASVWSINTRATLAYQLLALLVALGVAALIATRTFRTRFHARRHLPRYATAGTPVRYRVSIEHRARHVEAGLWLRDSLVVRAPSAADFARASGAGEARRNWFDRRVGYPRWAAMMRARRGARVPVRELPTLAPRVATSVDMTLTPLRRGYLEFGPLRVQRADPLGLYLAERHAGEGARLLVLPRRYPVAWREWTGGSRDRLGGASLAAAVGGSLEYACSREYRPGDARRLIDWRSWARLGVPVVKEFHDQCLVRQALVVDTASAAPDECFEAAISVAASFAAVSGGNGVVELLFVGTRAFRVESGPGLGTRAQMLEALACAQPAPPDHFDLLSRTVCQHAGDLSSAVLVLLGWDPARRELVRRLRARRVELLVLVVDAAASDALEPLADLEPRRLRRVPCARIGETLASLSGARR